MSRRKSSDESIISLFPFLSILACVIGTLTMLITAVALSQAAQPVSKENQAEVDAAEKRLAEFKELRQKIAEAKAAIDRLRKQSADAEALLRSLAQKKDAAEAERKRQLELQKKIDEQLAEVARLQKRIAGLQASLAELEKRIAELKGELKRRNDVPKEAVVQLQSRGTGHNLKPLFVECTGGTVVLLDGDEPKRLPVKGLEADTAFVTALERVKQDPNGTMIFLVRSNGVWAFQTASRLADAAGVRNGKLPVPGQGRLDLGAHAPKKGGG